MRVAYTIAQQHEAVALAAVVGAEAAADQLGMDVRSVRKWAAAAGQGPEIVVDDWQKLHDLAVARTTALVAGGKLRPREVAVIAGIAARNLRVGRLPTVPDEDADTDPESATAAARQRLWDWLDSLPEPDRLSAKRWLRDKIGQIIRSRREGVEPDPPELDRSDAAGAAMWDSFREGMAADLPRIFAENAEREAIEAARLDQRNRAGRWLEDDEADLLIAAEQALENIA